MPQSWTIRSLLAWMAQDFGALGLDTPRLDAEVLIAHVLGIDRVRLYMDLDRPLSAAELSDVRALVVRRRRREPVAYVVGQREFYRRAFAVSAAVLIPRPDTETLIERALELLPSAAPTRVLDLCTGSGAIAVTLAAERPLSQVTATDLSPDALAVARGNAERHGVLAQIRLLQGDLFEALPPGERYDLVVANPPYVRAGDLAGLAPELHHEPVLALTGGDTGFDVLTRLCDEVAGWLSDRGAALFEVGAGQAAQVAEQLARQPGLGEVRCHRDLGGVERVVEARLRAVSGAPSD
jgi:release factor glutamine methyltransferase